MLKVGLILYSVRDEMAKDAIDTVKKVGELGYKYIETCNHNAINDPVALVFRLRNSKKH